MSEPQSYTQSDDERAARIPAVMEGYAKDIDKHGGPLDSGLAPVLRFAAKRLTTITSRLDTANQAYRLAKENQQLLVSQLSTSQQEARRLREALDECQKAIGQNYGVLKQAQGHLEHAKIAGMVFYESAMRQFDAALTKAVAALSSTPTPVHSDTERLDWLCDTHAGLKWQRLDLLVSRGAIDAELAKEGK